MEQASAGEPIRFQGDYYDIDIKGWVRPHKPVRDRIPIYTAGVREGMCRMAGDVADGMIGHPICSMRWLDEVIVANFTQGLERSGRERSDFDYLPDGLLCDRRRRGARPRRRPPHDLLLRDRPHLRAGLGDARLRPTAQAVGDSFRAGDLAAVPGHVTDEMVDTYTAAGPLDKVRARVEAVAERGDGLFLTPPTYFIPPEQLGEYQHKLIEAFGPAARG